MTNHGTMYVYTVYLSTITLFRILGNKWSAYMYIFGLDSRTKSCPLASKQLYLVWPFDLSTWTNSLYNLWKTSYLFYHRQGVKLYQYNTVVLNGFQKPVKQILLFDNCDIKSNTEITFTMIRGSILCGLNEPFIGPFNSTFTACRTTIGWG